MPKQVTPHAAFVAAMREAEGACPCRSMEFLKQTDSRARWCNRSFCPCYMTIRRDHKLPPGYAVESCEWPVHASHRALALAFADAACPHGHSLEEWVTLYEQGMHHHDATCRSALLRECFGEGE